MTEYIAVTAEERAILVEVISDAIELRKQSLRVIMHDRLRQYFAGQKEPETSTAERLRSIIKNVAKMEHLHVKLQTGQPVSRPH